LENNHGNWVNPPRSSTTAGTAVARIVASIATRPTLSITASRIGPRSDRSPTLARSIRSVVISLINVGEVTTIPPAEDRQLDGRDDEPRSGYAPARGRRPARSSTPSGAPSVTRQGRATP